MSSQRFCLLTASARLSLDPTGELGQSQALIIIHIII